jgi:hypothetical protein
MRGTVETWVNSQWKYRAAPGQLSVEINTLWKIEEIGQHPRPELVSNDDTSFGRPCWKEVGGSWCHSDAPQFVTTIRKTIS